MDDAFGNWFAGFVDGEGCFLIQRSNKGTYTCKFSITLRDDDSHILEVIRSTLGFGRIYLRPQVYNGTMPQNQWRCDKKSDCASLVEILNQYPLRAKKRQDFVIWSEAVNWWMLQKRSGIDWSVLEKYMNDLRNGRQYASIST